MLWFFFEEFFFWWIFFFEDFFWRIFFWQHLRLPLTFDISMVMIRNLWYSKSGKTRWHIDGYQIQNGSTYDPLTYRWLWYNLERLQSIKCDRGEVYLWNPRLYYEKVLCPLCPGRPQKEITTPHFRKHLEQVHTMEGIWFWNIGPTRVWEEKKNLFS